MDAPFMGIAAGATRFNLTFPGVSGEYPLISERTDYAEKVRDALAQAGWDCLLKMNLPDTDEHMCRVVQLATKPMLTESAGYSKKEVAAREEERNALTSANDAKEELRKKMLVTALHAFGTALLNAFHPRRTPRDSWHTPHATHSVSKCDGS